MDDGLSLRRTKQRVVVLLAATASAVLPALGHGKVGQSAGDASAAERSDGKVEAHARPAEGLLPEVRVYGVAEKDVGFAPTQAQSAGKAPMRLLETPHSVSVVTRELMESRQVTNLQEALQTVAGVSPVNFGRRGFDDLFVRGFRTDSILIDGLVRGTGWTRLQSYGYERLEVFRGANSVLYGQVQPGGIVNAVSKRPKKAALAEAAVAVGSFGLRSVAADINRPLRASGKTALRVNALASDSEDPTDFVFRDDRWFAPSLSLDFGASTDFVLFATYNRSKWLRQQGVTPHGTLLPNPNGTVPLTRFSGEPSFGIYDIEHATLGYTLEHLFRPGLALRQNVRYEEERGFGNFVTNGTLQANRRLQNRFAVRQLMGYDILATDTSVLADFTSGAITHRLLVGLDARTGTSWLGSRACTIGPLDLFAPVYGQAATCPADLTSDAPSELTVVGLYLQDQIRFGNGWTALVGFRHDRSTRDTTDRIRNRRTVQRDNANTGSAGLVYEFWPGWSAYGSYSESFLPVSGQTFAGVAFEPETGQQWEVGLKHEARDVTGSLALYDLSRQNVITADPANPGFSVQTGEQRASGLELEVNVGLANGWTLNAAYAYTDAKVTRDSNVAIVGKPINLTPRHTLAAWATWQLPMASSTTFGLGVRHVSEQAGALPFALPSYTVFDASLAYTGSSFRLMAGVKNVLDEVYFDGAINANVVSPAAPRSFLLNAIYYF